MDFVFTELPTEVAHRVFDSISHVKQVSANCDASTARQFCLLQSGGLKIGCDARRDLKSTNDRSATPLHTNCLFF